MTDLALDGEGRLQAELDELIARWNDQASLIEQSREPHILARELRNCARQLVELRDRLSVPAAPPPQETKGPIIRCINCHRQLASGMLCWFGPDIGPFCETCYEHVKKHVSTVAPPPQEQPQEKNKI